MKMKSKVFASISTALLLTCCLERSISEAYVSYLPSGDELLHPTQTPDHHIVGTIQRATLSPDEHVGSATKTGLALGERP
jgi:hypothetical protein